MHADERDEDYLRLDELPPTHPADASHQCREPYEAARMKHLACVKLFTNNELLRKDSNGETALHHAARSKAHDIALYLIDKVPALKEIPSQNVEIPCLISAANGDLKMLEILLGGPLRLALQSALHRDVNGTSVLMAAVARGDNMMSMWLLKKFGRPLAVLPNYSNMLPIHVAAAQGNIDFMKSVIKLDSQMANNRDEFGCTPCVYAVQAGCLASVRFLVEGVRSEMGSVSNRGQSLLHIACLCGHEHVAKWILNRMGPEAILWPTNDKANVIHCAAFSGAVPCLHLLLSSFSTRKRRQVLALRDGRGNSPLHLAAINNHTEAAELMLKNGADANLVNGAGHSALGIASLRGHQEMIQILSQHGDGKKLKKPQSPLPIASPITTVQAQDVTVDVRSSPKKPSQESPLSGYSSSPSGKYTLRPSLSPHALSSGYSSAGEMYAESIVSGPDIVERHRMRYVEDGNDCVKDFGAQTDDDLLEDKIKILDDAAWTGLGLSAVEHIDRVLDELNVSDLSPLPKEKDVKIKPSGSKTVAV